MIPLRLLRTILRQVSPATNAPLRLELHDMDVVAAVMQSEDVRRELAGFNDPAEVCRLLDRLLENLLDVEHSRTTQFVERETLLNEESDELEATPGVDELTNRLAAWLGRLRAAVGSVHPQALEIVQLHVAGYGSRDIADRLDVGLRLTKRIARDTIAALRAAPSEG